MDRLRGQRNKNRECLVIVLFVISVAVQIYFFYSGAVGEVFEKSIGGKDGMIILGGLAKYLQLIGGIAAAYLVSFVMYTLSFGTITTMLLDFGLQAAVYYFLIWIIGVFIVVASLLVIGLISIAIIVFFLDSY